MISVMNRSARHTSPCPVAELQTTVHLSACGAGPAGCIPATYAYQIDAFPSALVLKDGIEPADARICDAVRKVTIPEHALHIQVLDADRTHLAVVRQLMSDLVNVIKPLVGNLGMNTSDMMLNPLPSGRALRLVTQFSLVMLQALFSCLGKVRSIELPAIGTYSKGFHTSVNTDSGSFFHNGTWFRCNGCINKNGSVVLPVRIHGYGNILDLAVEASMQDDRDILALGDAESLMLPVDGTVLRIVERLPVLLALEKWMTSSMLPPVLESICHLLNSILKGLGVDLAKPRVYFLQGDELLLGAEATYADSCPAPQQRHVVKRAVVCHAAAAEALGEELRLIRCGIEPIFIRLQHSTNILILCLIIKIEKHQNEQVQCFLTLDLQCRISYCVLYQISLQPATLQCGRTTQDSAPAECIQPWNRHSNDGSDARPCAFVHRGKTECANSTYCLPSERLFLVLHAERIRIPAEISVIVDSVLLRGDRRTYIGKDRGALYRKSKNKILTPFHLPTKARENSRAIS